jgi:RNA polymerase sigma factor (sigma-70 family)
MLFKRSYTDNIIIEQIKNLNKEALGYLYENNYITVLNYVTSHGGTEEDAREELSNALIHLWQRINRENFNTDFPLEKVIFSLVRENFHKHLLQKSQKNESVSGPQEELTERMKHLYEVLDKQSQEILHLYYFEGWNANRIAEQFRLKTPGEAQDLILAARQKLEKIVRIIIS